MRRGLHHAALLREALDEAARPAGVEQNQRPRPAGSVSAISCTRGCRNSAISRICPSATLHLLAYALETARPDFQFGDADRVLIGHAERELARGLGEQQPAPLPCLRSACAIGSSRVEIVAGVGRRPGSRRAARPRRARSARAGSGKLLGLAPSAAPARAEWRAPAAVESAAAALAARRRRRCRRAKPASNAARLSLTPTPPRWIAASNAMRWIGSTLAPASAPNSTALITLPVASASCAMSHAMMPLRRGPAGLEQLRGDRRGRRPARSSRSSHRRGWSRRSAWCGRA